MRLSTLNRGGGLFSGAAITGNKTITEGDLNSFFTVTAVATVTLPKPQDIKAKLGESLLLMSMTTGAVSVALSAGATIDNYTGPLPLVKGLPMDLIVSSGTSWAIRGVQAASDAEITTGTEQSKFLNSLEHAEHHLKDIPGYNYIINGNFDIWQRGTSQTFVGYGSADRWSHSHGGATVTHSKQVFSLGATFPDGSICPTNYIRSVVVAGTLASDICYRQQKIERVTTMAGKKAFISFYAKASSVVNMSFELTQNFGTGGSPSTTVSGLGVQKITLSTTWQRYTAIIDIPSISGKVLGSNSNDWLGLQLWFDAGTNFNSRTNSLGHQSGTFDIACVSLVEGDKDIKSIHRSYDEELALCQRYYQQRSICWCGDTTLSAVYYIDVPLTPAMRVSPIVTSVQGTFANGNMNARSVGVVYNTNLTWGATSASTGPSRGYADMLYLDAEL